MVVGAIGDVHSFQVGGEGSVVVGSSMHPFKV